MELNKDLMPTEINKNLIVNNIKSKNLFDINNLNRGGISNETGQIQPQDHWAVYIDSQNPKTGTVTFTSYVEWKGVISDYIEVEAGQPYTLSMTSNNNTLWYLAFYYDSSYNFVSSYLWCTSASNNATVTIPANVKYVRFILETSTGSTIPSSITLSNIQFEKGSLTAFTPFEDIDSNGLKMHFDRAIDMFNDTSGSDWKQMLQNKIEYCIANMDLTKNNTAAFIGGGWSGIKYGIGVCSKTGTVYQLAWYNSWGTFYCIKYDNGNYDYRRVLSDEAYLHPSNNLNDFKEEGKYAYDNGSQGFTNAPTNHGIHILKVTTNGSDWLTQEDYCLDWASTTMEKYIREYNPGGWSNWQKIAFDDDTGWQTCTMETGFAHSNWNPLQYRRKNSIVYIRGTVDTNEATSWAKIIATLPVGFRPGNEIDMVCRTSWDQVLKVIVSSGGSIQTLNLNDGGSLPSGQNISIAISYIQEG